MRTARPSFLRDPRGFTGAERALLITFALAIILLVGGLLRGGSEKAAGDARRTLAAGLGSAAQLGQPVGPMPAAGPGGGAGAPATPGQGGTPGPGPQAQEPGTKIGGGEASRQWEKNFKEKKFDRKYGGAKDQPEESDKKGKVELDAKAEVKRELFRKEGSLSGDIDFAGKTEKLQAGYGTVGADAAGSLSWKEGLQGGVSADARISALRETGAHTLPGDIKESHEINVLTAQANVDAKAGISREVIGAKLSAGASANVAEGQINVSKVFKIPFTPIGIEISGGAQGAFGAQASAEGKAGYFRGKDGKNRLGFSFGGKLGLGLGGGLKGGLGLVWD
jgi:hypothetical protein